MILDVVRQAWRESPLKVVLAVPAAIAFVFLLRLLLIVVIVAGHAS